MVAAFYLMIIIRPQNKTFAQVPIGLQPAVHAMLLANGYDDNGNLIPVPVTPNAPNVVADDNLNTVTGMDTTMEYDLDATAYVPYVAATFNAIDFSGNHTLLVRVAAQGINPCSLDTTLTFTTNLTTPIAPAVTADDDKNIIVGIDGTMEYAIDETTTYVVYNATTPPDLSGAHTVNVRVSAVANVSTVSLPTTLTFTVNPITPPAPSVTADDVNNVIIGIDETMEYAVDGATSYTIYDTAYPIDLIGNHTVNVRVAAVAKINYASPNTALVFTAN